MSKRWQASRFLLFCRQHNINVIKTASGAHKVAMAMVEKLCRIDESLSPYFYVFPIQRC